MAKLSASLLRRAARASAQAMAVQHELTAAFRDRYGVTYSDVDCDALIDILDYAGGAGLTVAECDRLMAASGAPVITKATGHAATEGEG